MASQLADYELRRPENIKRNEEMMASLKIQFKLSEIKSAKDQRVPQRYGISREKSKAKSNESRLGPDSLNWSDKTSATPTSSPQVLGPLGFGDSCLNDSELSLSSSLNGTDDRDKNACTWDILDSNFESDSLRLETKNVKRRVIPGMVCDLRLFPTHDLEMIAAGDAMGNVGFWDMKSKEEENSTHLYRLHSAPVSGIIVHPLSLSKVYTSGHES